MRHRRVQQMAAPLVLILASGVSTVAQETTGGVLGRVVDVAGMPLETVRVMISGPALVAPRTTVTDARGLFQLLRVPVGEFEVRFERIGLRTLVQTGVRVRLGRATALGEIAMAVEAIEIEPMVVSARQAIDPTATTIGSELQAEAIEQLPTARDYQSVLELMPQANASAFLDPVNVGGATGLENSYHIDGVNVTDAYRAVGGTQLPFNFVEAIELKQGGYEAEFGGALGGQVNVVTKSGGDELEFGAYGFFTNEALAATPIPLPGAIASEGSTTYDIGVHAGGPLIPEKLRFFVAYNPSFDKQNVRVPGLGLHPAEVTRHMFAGKLDWDPTPGSTVALSLFGDPASHQLVNPTFASFVPEFETVDPALGVLKTGGVNFSLVGRAHLGPQVLLEATVARHNRRETEHGATEQGRDEPRIADAANFPPLIVSGGWFVESDVRSSRTAARVASTFLLGAHRLKVGVEYQENRLDLFETNKHRIQRGFFDDSSYTVDVQDLDFVLLNRIPAVYVQDSWSVGRRWQLNAGIRWDAQHIVGSDGSVAQKFGNQWQPRLGLVFQPGELGSQKIFGSFGRYYLQMPLFLSSLGHSMWDSRVINYGPYDPRVYPDSVQSEFVRSDPCCILFEEVEGAVTDHFDEFGLGYERALGTEFSVRAYALHRVLRNNFQYTFDAELGTFLPGNPGEGYLTDLPETHRTYSALELTARWQGRRGMAMLSYVLSRNEGNYSGAMAQEVPLQNQGGPNNNFTLTLPQQGVNNDGLLPNDRTHVIKLTGAYRLVGSLTAGTYFTVQSGTPLNEFGVMPLLGNPLFLVPRGTAGRTPTLWDLNFRLTYDLPIASVRRSRIIVDLQHLGNPQVATNIDQRRFLRNSAPLTAPYDEQVAGQNTENPQFGEPTAFLAPFALRLGIEVAF